MCCLSIFPLLDSAMRIYNPSLQALMSHPRGFEEATPDRLPEPLVQASETTTVRPESEGIVAAEHGPVPQRPRFTRLGIPVAAISILVACATWLRARQAHA